MGPGVLILLAALGWGCCAMAGPAASPAQPAAEQIAPLIAQLGSPRFKEREAASQGLEALGSAALEALHRAADDPDAEVRRRSLALIQAIDKRLESARVLAPKRVRLVYRDKSVREAVLDFARQTGFAIQIEPASRPKLIGRRITLDTGETTFWQAFDQFCRKAGLVEYHAPYTAQYMNPYMGGPVILADGSPYYGAVAPAQLVLAAGKPLKLPTYYAGAVRIQMLAPATPLVGHTREDGEALIGLEVSPEPGMQWQGIIGMRVLEAADDRDLHLKQNGVFVGDGGDGANLIGSMMMWSADGRYVPPTPKDPRQVPVRLQLRHSPSRKLKTLRGIVSAQVQTPPEPLVTVRDILKAAGRTVMGPHGGSLKVLEVKRLPRGQLQLQVQVSPADRPPMVVNVWMAGGMTPQPPAGLGPSSLSLEDAQGEKFQLLRVDKQQAVPNNTVSFEYTLTYEPPHPKAEAARLVFTGTRTVVIDIPFTLKDVPLP